MTFPAGRVLTPIRNQAFLQPALVNEVEALLRRAEQARAHERLSSLARTPEDLADACHLLANLHHRALLDNPHHFPSLVGLVANVADWSRLHPCRIDRPPQPVAESISVIMCSIDPDREARTVAMYRDVLAGTPFEIIVIRDARSLCEGYNRGIRQSSGEIVICSHDDIEILSPSFATRLTQHLRRVDLLGVAGTTRLIQPFWVSAGWPHVHGMVAQRSRENDHFDVTIFGPQSLCTTGAQALDGCFLAMHRSLLDSLAFDEKNLTGWHGYDIDFSFSAWLTGFRVAICTDIFLIHDSPGQFDAACHDQAEILRRKHAHRFAPPPEHAVHGLFAVRLHTRAQLATFAERMLSYAL
ncbi:MAG: glycosyltransferase [Magnetococcales bacterium]|nr:glycosyltransferase [Magnetococcales bacterium]